MAKARVLYVNLAWDLATNVTTAPPSSEATGYPATNLFSQKRSKPWRSATATTDQHVTLTFSGSKTPVAIVIGNFKIHTGGSVKAQYWTGSVYADLGTFTIPASNRTKVVALFGLSQATARVRFLFVNTGAVNEYVELGLAYIVDASGFFQTTVNYADGISWVPFDPSTSRSAIGGQEQSRILPAYLQFTASFRGVPEATDYTSWLAVRDVVGCHLPFVLAIDPGNADKIVFGKMSSGLQTTGVPFARWDISVPFREMV
jgi:hypothetical protein